MFCLAEERVSKDGEDVEISVRNNCDQAVVIDWLDFEGRKVRPGDVVPSGEEWGQRTHDMDVFLISWEDGGEVACVRFPVDSRGEEIPLSRIADAGEAKKHIYVPKVRKSGDGGDRVGVSVLNDLGRDVGFQWVNYDGKLHGEPEIVAAGLEWGQETFSMHPFLISGAANKRELACVCFAGVCRVTLSSVLTAAGTPLVVLNRNRRDGKAKRRHNQVVVCADSCVGGDIPWKSLVGEPCVTCDATCKRYVPQVLGGVQFFVADGLFETCPRLAELLEGDISEMRRILPAPAMALLQDRMAIWAQETLQYPGEKLITDSGSVHWGPTWPKAKGDLGQKGSCIDVVGGQCLVDAYAVQPAWLLHEAAHAYHCHRVEDVDDIIKDCYERAMATGTYSTSEFLGEAHAEKHYGATNHHEYFAESSEAFFSSRRFRNDFFPYVSCELRAFDPIAYEMCEKVWGVRGADLVSRTEYPADWLERLAKVSPEEFEKRFREADVNGNGVLEPDEFDAAISGIVEGIGPDELEAARAFTDADADGSISLDEFRAWLTSQLGAHKTAR